MPRITSPTGGVGWHVLGTFPTPRDLGLTVTLSNGDGDPIVCDAARLDRTSPDTSVVINPGDQVTFTATDGWVTTSAGVQVGVSGLPVANLAGRNSLVPFQSVPKTMGVGWNVLGAECDIPVPPYANLAKNIQISGDVLATDAHGNPTLFSGATSYPMSWPSAAGRGMARSRPADLSRRAITW